MAVFSKCLKYQLRHGDPLLHVPAPPFHTAYWLSLLWPDCCIDPSQSWPFLSLLWSLFILHSLQVVVHSLQLHEIVLQFFISPVQPNNYAITTHVFHNQKSLF